MSYSPKTVAGLRGLVNAVIVAVFFAGAAVLSDGEVTGDELVLAASGLLGVLAARWQEAFTLDSTNLPSATPLGGVSDKPIVMEPREGGPRERGQANLVTVLVMAVVATVVVFAWVYVLDIPSTLD